MKLKDCVMVRDFHLILFLALAVTVVVGPSLTAQPASSAGATGEVERVLGELAINSTLEEVPKRVYRLSETDLNSYLGAKLGKADRKGLESISVRLKQGSFVTVVKVNMDQVQLKDESLTARMLSALLRGAHTLEVEGQLQVQEGVGKYQVQQASLDGIPLPASVMEMVLSTLGRQQDPPFDLAEPFPMPYGISTVDVQPGQVTIETGQEADSDS